LLLISPYLGLSRRSGSSQLFERRSCTQDLIHYPGKVLWDRILGLLLLPEKTPGSTRGARTSKP
jgi:hypothetical protein